MLEHWNNGILESGVSEGIDKPVFSEKSGLRRVHFTWLDRNELCLDLKNDVVDG